MVTKALKIFKETINYITVTFLSKISDHLHCIFSCYCGTIFNLVFVICDISLIKQNQVQYRYFGIERSFSLKMVPQNGKLLY